MQSSSRSDSDHAFTFIVKTPADPVLLEALQGLMKAGLGLQQTEQGQEPGKDSRCATDRLPDLNATDRHQAAIRTVRHHARWASEAAFGRRPEAPPFRCGVKPSIRD